jgi:hypothetical protein
VQVVNGALRVGSGLEDSAVIVLQNLEPRGDVGCMVFLDFRRDFETGAKERGAQLGNEFLASIAFVAPNLAAEVTIQLQRMFGAVDTFVRQRGVETFGIAPTSSLGLVLTCA